MIKRTIEISSHPTHISARQKHLVLSQGGDVVSTIPCEDIGVVVVDQPATTYTQGALAALAESGAALIVCGRNHLPAALLLSMADHSQVVWRINEQLSASKPLRKQLWKQLVQAKIRGQAANLLDHCRARRRLLAIAEKVRSGDPDNKEAQASRVYWEHFLKGRIFRRDQSGGGLNGLLNYGYSVMRAAVARAIVAAGLLPSVGLQHHHRSNSFCLADDLLEPIRPIVDRRARLLYEGGMNELTPSAKAGLLSLLADSVRICNESGPLMVSLHRMAASLVKCFQGSAKALDIPTVTETFDGKSATASRSEGGLHSDEGDNGANDCFSKE